MDLVPQPTTHDAVMAIDTLRAHAPYKYGGKWYVAEIRGIGYAYRTMAGILAKSRKEDPTNTKLSVATYHP